MTVHRAIKLLLPTFILLACQADSSVPDNQPMVPGVAVDIGPYSVGYSTQRIGGAGADTIPVSIWYPAQPSPEGAFLTLRDYYHVLGTTEAESRLAELERILSDEGIPSERLQEALDRTGFAQMDLEPLPGPFPAVVLSPGMGGAAFDLDVLCEHLASRGIMVVAVPSRVGPGSPEVEPGALELASDDMLRAIEFVASLPNADTKRLGLLGYSHGGSAAALTAMRSDQPQAVVLLDPGFRVPANMDDLAAAAGFSPGQLDQRLMVVYARGVPQVPDHRLFDALPSSPVVVSLLKARHGDFSPLFVQAFVVPKEGRDGWDPAHAIASHDASVRYASAFLSAHLAGDAEALRFLRAGPSENGLDSQIVNIERSTTRSR